MRVLEPNRSCLILFRNVHDVIKSERLIKSKGFEYQIMPVPSNISAECGMCIEIEQSHSQDVCKLLELNLIYHNLYSK